MIKKEVLEYNYTIPSDNRELQLIKELFITRKIIPYQVITGNYNYISSVNLYDAIIPYQVITGNYNTLSITVKTSPIIPYQVITGNYNLTRDPEVRYTLYHTK